MFNIIFLKAMEQEAPFCQTPFFTRRRRFSANCWGGGTLEDNRAFKILLKGSWKVIALKDFAVLIDYAKFGKFLFFLFKQEPFECCQSQHQVFSVPPHGQNYPNPFLYDKNTEHTSESNRELSKQDVWMSIEMIFNFFPSAPLHPSLMQLLFHDQIFDFNENSERASGAEFYFSHSGFYLNSNFDIMWDGRKLNNVPSFFVEMAREINFNDYWIVASRREKKVSVTIVELETHPRRN